MGQRGKSGEPRQQPDQMAMRLRLAYQRYWKALDTMEGLNQRLVVAQHGQPAAPSERMIASLLFTRGVNLLMALRTLLKEGLSLEGAALLRPMFDNAADACYIAGHQTETSTALAERLIDFQPVPRAGRMKAEKEAGLSIDPEEYEAARSARARFYKAYRVEGDEHDWSGVKPHVKLPYLLDTLNLVAPQQHGFIALRVVPYLHEFVHDGPVVWKQLIDQNDQRISYQIGRQDRPAMMHFAVPLAVALSAATAHAAVRLWARDDLFPLVVQQFASATNYLPPEHRETAA